MWQRPPAAGYPPGCTTCITDMGGRAQQEAQQEAHQRGQGSASGNRARQCQHCSSVREQQAQGSPRTETPPAPAMPHTCCRAAAARAPSSPLVRSPPLPVPSFPTLPVSFPLSQLVAFPLPPHSLGQRGQVLVVGIGHGRQEVVAGHRLWQKYANTIADRVSDECPSLHRAPKNSHKLPDSARCCHEPICPNNTQLPAAWQRLKAATCPPVRRGAGSRGPCLCGTPPCPAPARTGAPPPHLQGGKEGGWVGGWG